MSRIDPVWATVAELFGAASDGLAGTSFAGEFGLHVTGGTLR